MDVDGQAPERRKFPRVINPCVLCIYKDGDVEKGENVTGLVYDISQGGLSFLADRPYFSAENLKLEISLPGYECVTDVRVIRSQEWEGFFLTAATFVNLSQEEENRLRSAVFLR